MIRTDMRQAGLRKCLACHHIERWEGGEERPSRCPNCGADYEVLAKTFAAELAARRRTPQAAPANRKESAAPDGATGLDSPTAVPSSPSDTVGWYGEQIDLPPSATVEKSAWNEKPGWESATPVPRKDASFRPSGAILIVVIVGSILGAIFGSPTEVANQGGSATPDTNFIASAVKKKTSPFFGIEFSASPSELSQAGYECKKNTTIQCNKWDVDGGRLLFEHRATSVIATFGDRQAGSISLISVDLRPRGMDVVAEISKAIDKYHRRIEHVDDWSGPDPYDSDKRLTRLHWERPDGSLLAMSYSTPIEAGSGPFSNSARLSVSVFAVK